MLNSVDRFAFYLDRDECPRPRWNCGPPCPPVRCCPCCCCAGADGKSAYQIAVDNGFVGDEAAWLASLKGEPGPSGPFLSSFIEAVGSTQRVENGGSVVFDTDPDTLDIAGTGIEIDSAGTGFILREAGLYHVEWSMNLSAAGDPVLVGLLENGAPASALANGASLGNYASGALIQVTESDLPYHVSLHNFGAPLTIENPAAILNTAASIRILRFADGPKG